MRDIEIKNKSETVSTRGEKGGKEGEGLSRNIYKGPMDKAEGGKD